MRILEHPPRFVFFTGKGGVGKTSVACATAVRLAESGKRVLLVSTDPASNVGQVFGTEIGNRVTVIAGVANLTALEIDPQAAAAAYRDRIVGPVRGTLPDAVVSGIEEQLSGACTTEIAAFDEFTGLLIDSPATADLDHIIFDTAPTGHTIRLLQLPGAWSGFLEHGRGDASCLGPLAGLEKQRAQYKAAVEALADPARTRLVMVSRAQPSALSEAARTHDELAAIGLTAQYLVINGVLPTDEAKADPLAAAIVSRERDAISEIPPALRDLPRDVVALKPFDIVGIDAVRELLDGEVTLIHDHAPPLSAIDAPTLAELVDDIAADGHGLVMVMGKGGVGKTTVAASIALELSARGLPVHLTTSDPAAHLAETLAGAGADMTVSHINPGAETARYRQHVMETKGARLDADGRALLAEDLRSPCTEEIAVFQAFSRIIREAGTKYVVMDTAPTGHTLLLLDATGAYHRDVVRNLTDSPAHFTTPMMHLQDPTRTKVVIVALAETTPVLEAAELQDDLRRAGIEPWAWVINQSLAASRPSSPLLRRRASNELREIDAIANHYAHRYAVVPMELERPTGAVLRQLAVAAS